MKEHYAVMYRLVPSGFFLSDRKMVWTADCGLCLRLCDFHCGWSQIYAVLIMKNMTAHTETDIQAVPDIHKNHLLFSLQVLYNGAKNIIRSALNSSAKSRRSWAEEAEGEHLDCFRLQTSTQQFRLVVTPNQYLSVIPAQWHVTGRHQSLMDYAIQSILAELLYCSGCYQLQMWWQVFAAPRALPNRKLE